MPQALIVDVFCGGARRVDGHVDSVHENRLVLQLVSAQCEESHGYGELRGIGENVWCFRPPCWDNLNSNGPAVAAQTRSSLA